MCLSVVLLATKSCLPTNLACDASKLMKFAAYKFTLEQICSVEAKLFASLQCNSDLDYSTDDLFTMVQVSLFHLTPFICQSGKLQALAGNEPHSMWVEELSYELLETVYLDHELLTGKTEPLLAASIVLSALYILSHDDGLFKKVPSFHKLSSHAYMQLLRSPAIISMRLAQFW